MLWYHLCNVTQRCRILYHIIISLQALRACYPIILIKGPKRSFDGSRQMFHSEFQILNKGQNFLW